MVKGRVFIKNVQQNSTAPCFHLLLSRHILSQFPREPVVDLEACNMPELIVFRPTSTHRDDVHDRAKGQQSD